jgi:large subunit ribosomal protein L1
MESKIIIETRKSAKAEAKKRNFTQKVDLVINLKDLDLKKNANHVDFYTELKHPVGKKMKICALVGIELFDEASKVCDFVISQTEFPKYVLDKHLAKKITEEYDYFIAQADLMGKVAQTFGRIFGPRGKMPNPKAGCVVPPKTNLQPIYDRLQKTIRITAKKDPIIHLMVGNEDMKEEDLAENIDMTYDQLIHHLPGETNNVKSVFVKLSMGKPIKLI